jgi:ankyrin repeat protein
MKVNVNIGGGVCGSPLHMAVVKLEDWLVSDLINRGAKISISDCDGNTPLHYVMKVFSKNPTKSAVITETLVNGGINPNQRNLESWTALHIAIRKSHFDAVKCILGLN